LLAASFDVGGVIGTDVDTMSLGVELTSFSNNESRRSAAYQDGRFVFTSRTEEPAPTISERVSTACFDPAPDNDHHLQHVALVATYTMHATNVAEHANLFIFCTP
jgi:hypothetical protein